LIIDASALLAIVLAEPDARCYARGIAPATQRRMPSVTWFEASMRVDCGGDATAVRRFNEFVGTFGIEIIPFTLDHAEAARIGRRLFGRPHHPALLNFGDCLLYGVAKVEDEPLLFKGNDFFQTGLKSALKD
jgi:ribonuclease VapC